MPQIRLHGRETDRSRPEVQPRNPANAPHGEQLGDQRIFTDELRQLDNSGQPTGPVVGEHSGHCTLVRKGPAGERIYQCFATFRLADGLLTARTLFDLNNIPAGGIKAAITGGTDKYDKARGQITATFPADKITIFEIDL